MLYVSDEEKAAFNSGNQKYLTLTFSDGTVITNDDIYTGSMSFEQSICDEEALIYGDCSAALFKVKVFGTTKRYKNLIVYPVLRAGEYQRPLGKFTVVSDKATSDKLYRELECYDDLYTVLSTNYADWYNALQFPMTLKQYRDAFFNHVHITQRSVTLINDNMTITKNMVTNEYSGLEILKNICEINACFGHIDFEGKFRYVVMTGSDYSLYPRDDLYPDPHLYPRDWISERIQPDPYIAVIDDSLYPQADTLYPADDLYPRYRKKEMVLGNAYLQGSLQYEEFNTAVITEIQLRHTENDIGAVVSTTVGVDGNCYIIEENPLLFGKTTQELTVIGTRILAIVPISYIPSSVKVRAMPWHELGDIINIVSKSRVITMPILTRKITGITANIDEYSAKGVETYGQNANSYQRSIKILNQRTNELIRTVDETISRITLIEADNTSQWTEIRQNATDITLEAQRATAAEGTLDGKITVNANAITAEVTRATEAEGSLSGRITVNANAITSEVTRATEAEGTLSSTITQTASSLYSEISDTSSSINSRITQTINNISLSVSNNESTAGITISIGDGDISGSDTGTINMTGLVTFTDLSTSGSTSIHGNNIQTGTLEADRLVVGGGDEEASRYTLFNTPVKFTNIVKLYGNTDTCDLTVLDGHEFQVQQCIRAVARGDGECFYGWGDRGSSGSSEGYMDWHSSETATKGDFVFNNGVLTSIK